MKDQTDPSKGNATLLSFRQNIAWFAVRPKAVARAFAVAVARKLPPSARNLLGRVFAVMGRHPVHQLSSQARIVVWSRIDRFRPLLARQPAELSLSELIGRRLLKRLLKAPDGRYRRALARVDAQLKGRGVSHGKNSIAFKCSVMMMIGTLGPGGAERQLVVTAKGLRKSAKLKVCVACANLSSSTSRFFLPELESAGISTSVIGSEADDNVSLSVRAAIDTLPCELREISLYAKTLAAERPEIVHLWMDEVNVKGGIAAVLTGVPKIIISQRSLPPINFSLHRPYMREAYRWLARQPGVKMINNSGAGARAYEAWLGLQQGSIGVVHNGYAFDESELAHYQAGRIEYRQRVGIPTSALIVGTVMRLGEEKRPLLWLEIASLIRQAVPEVCFLVIGDGPLRFAMEARADQSDLAGSVFFAGNIKDPMTAIASMDMLLLTSRAEGLPNVLIEAQFLGVPVVATPAGGAPEAVNHGKSGWLLDSWDAESSSRQIVRLLLDKQWRETATRCGPEFAFARFGVQRAIDETLAVYSLNSR
ncbi:glycosyltransferase [Bradyrhizobium sp. AUGA SZCCT0042]|uniref:glycosyltransferase n=1 Tax=Bradyrhizobium sp. AUGA SZCCT0042 TaxID=2807651 RepID=UPI001BA68ED6|nr:glycosyltransferase [Bradyrhizobium sp. AUGA SZCCT0042]MBR1301752.1 glycosyltransferase [Bradyrhizobium sp. AUGA SZCCT0042]